MNQTVLKITRHASNGHKLVLNFDGTRRITSRVNSSKAQENYEYDTNGNKTLKTSLDNIDYKYKHDENGNIIEKEDSQGSRINYSYNDNNQKTEKFFNSQLIKTYIYDEEGRLSEEIMTNGEINKYTYENNLLIMKSSGFKDQNNKYIETYCYEKEIDFINMFYQNFTRRQIKSDFKITPDKKNNIVLLSHNKNSIILDLDEPDFLQNFMGRCYDFSQDLKTNNEKIKSLGLATYEKDDIKTTITNMENLALGYQVELEKQNEINLKLNFQKIHKYNKAI